MTAILRWLFRALAIEIGMPVLLAVVFLSASVFSVKRDNPILTGIVGERLFGDAHAQ